MTVDIPGLVNTHKLSILNSPCTYVAYTYVPMEEPPLRPKYILYRYMKSSNSKGLTSKTGTWLEHPPIIVPGQSPLEESENSRPKKHVGVSEN